MMLMYNSPDSPLETLTEYCINLKNQKFHLLRGVLLFVVDKNSNLLRKV